MPVYGPWPWISARNFCSVPGTALSRCSIPLLSRARRLRQLGASVITGQNKIISERKEMSRNALVLKSLALAATLALMPAASMAQQRQATAELRLDQPGVVIAPEVYGQF